MKQQPQTEIEVLKGLLTLIGCGFQVTENLLTTAEPLNVEFSSAGDLFIDSSTPKGNYKPKCVYKIQDRTTKLFSKGGSTPRFAKTGKSWPSLAALKSHLKLVTQGLSGRKPGLLTKAYKNCDIVTYTVNQSKLEAVV